MYVNLGIFFSKKNAEIFDIFCEKLILKVLCIPARISLLTTNKCKRACKIEIF